MIQKRAGWLIILFLSEMLTASAMGYFDEEISKAVVLALFVPLIISSGGNSGSQAATLIIRAMALKEVTLRDWWYVMRREIFSGLALGTILGIIGFIRIAVWQKLGLFNYTEHWAKVALTMTSLVNRNRNVGHTLWVDDSVRAKETWTRSGDIERSFCRNSCRRNRIGYLLFYRGGNSPGNSIINLLERLLRH